MKKISILIIIVFILFSKSCSYEDINKNTEETTIKIENEETSYKIDKKISEIAGSYKDNISIYYKNLDTEEEYLLNPDRYYIAASTTKVPLCMMILDQVFEGALNLEDEIYYEEEDDEDGSGVLYYLEDVTNVTIGEAVRLSIIESDNVAKNMLRRISEISITDYLIDITGDESIPYENYITARQLYVVLDRLYENPNNNPYYELLIDYMTKTVFHDRLDKYIPHDIVAHKIGDYYRYYHDCGIIYGKDDYIIVILTRDIGNLSDEAYNDGTEDERYLLDWGSQAYEIIGNISKEIYLNVEGNY
ncbi:beta-lactamase [Clostridium sartagoforme AAU1]|uniref:Beta-lactamase n=1 Tax=Clostridium sartagoforme AAU1 TaxID=1202534 RepID=R9CDW6_9CLOT|nr:serine hydrolase [Clostridium sartagoforme]EOR27554.1 beta-lactamase [Clostridium sartagoforme AAU1]